jgi:hypothetical protein
MKPVIARAKKTNPGRWSRLASTRGLPAIAFFRAAPGWDVTDLSLAF